MQTADGRQALLLPDLEGVDTVEQQLRITCRKGGIDPEPRPATGSSASRWSGTTRAAVVPPVHAVRVLRYHR